MKLAHSSFVQQTSIGHPLDTRNVTAGSVLTDHPSPPSHCTLQKATRLFLPGMLDFLKGKYWPKLNKAELASMPPASSPVAHWLTRYTPVMPYWVFSSCYFKCPSRRQAVPHAQGHFPTSGFRLTPCPRSGFNPTGSFLRESPPEPEVKPRTLPFAHVCFISNFAMLESESSPPKSSSQGCDLVLFILL